MSLSIVPYSSILRHPTNNSVSKQVHQFAKAPRFQSVNPELYLNYSDVQMHSTSMIVIFQKDTLALDMEQSLISLEL
jgi:hypothetical protein